MDFLTNLQLASQSLNQPQAVQWPVGGTATTQPLTLPNTAQVPGTGIPSAPGSKPFSSGPLTMTGGGAGANPNFGASPKPAWGGFSPNLKAAQQAGQMAQTSVRGDVQQRLAELAQLMARAQQFGV